MLWRFRRELTVSESLCVHHPPRRSGKGNRAEALSLLVARVFWADHHNLLAPAHNLALIAHLLDCTAYFHGGSLYGTADTDTSLTATLARRCPVLRLRRLR